MNNCFQSHSCIGWNKTFWLWKVFWLCQKKIVEELLVVNSKASRRYQADIGGMSYLVPCLSWSTLEFYQSLSPNLAVWLNLIADSANLATKESIYDMMRTTIQKREQLDNNLRNFWKIVCSILIKSYSQTTAWKFFIELIEALWKSLKVFRLNATNLGPKL